MTPGGPRIAVVVVTYNSATLLNDLITSLEGGMQGVAWELVVVDNASTDGTPDRARALAPWANVLETGCNGGYAAGINAGVARAGEHDAVLVLNPDVRLQSGCALALYRAVSEPGVGVAVPRLEDGDRRLIESMRREPTILRAAADALVGASRAGRLRRLGEVVTDHRQYDIEQDTDWAEGSTQLISAECWAICGQWDESFFLYSEEADFNLRARDAGFATRYVPSARATHLEGDSGASPRLWPLLVLNRVKLFRHRNGAALTVPFWLVLVAREASRALLGRQTSRAALRALVNPARLREPRGPHSVR